MIREQLKAYREYEALVRNGDYYRLSDPAAGEFCAWMFAAPDRSSALLSVVRTQIQGNSAAAYVKLRGLDADACYEECATGKVYAGAALMEAGLPLPFAGGEYEAYQMAFRRVEQK